MRATLCAGVLGVLGVLEVDHLGPSKDAHTRDLHPRTALACSQARTQARRVLRAEEGVCPRSRCHTADHARDLIGVLRPVDVRISRSELGSERHASGLLGTRLLPCSEREQPVREQRCTLACEQIEEHARFCVVRHRALEDTEDRSGIHACVEAEHGDTSRVVSRSDRMLYGCGTAPPWEEREVQVHKTERQSCQHTFREQRAVGDDGTYDRAGCDDALQLVRGTFRLDDGHIALPRPARHR